VWAARAGVRPARPAPAPRAPPATLRRWDAGVEKAVGDVVECVARSAGRTAGRRTRSGSPADTPAPRPAAPQVQTGDPHPPASRPVKGAIVCSRVVLPDPRARRSPTSSPGPIAERSPLEAWTGGSPDRSGSRPARRAPPGRSCRRDHYALAGREPRAVTCTSPRRRRTVPARPHQALGRAGAGHLERRSLRRTGPAARSPARPGHPAARAVVTATWTGAWSHRPPAAGSAKAMSTPSSARALPEPPAEHASAPRRGGADPEPVAPDPAGHVRPRHRGDDAGGTSGCPGG